MCLILFAYRLHPKFRLIFASNRDEFYERPTARIHRWEDAPIIAGKDLQAGGTWMGLSRDSRWAALTNYRDGKDILQNAPSRGDLVAKYLTSPISAKIYSRNLQESGSKYNGYNILLGDKEHLYYQSNKSDRVLSLGPGIYGLSNHLLNTPWPKVERGKRGLAKCLENDFLEKEEIFALLKNDHKAADEMLPDTGIPYDWEKALSAMFIEIPGYGTRVSTLILQEYSGKTYIEERAYHPEGEPQSFELAEVDFVS